MAIKLKNRNREQKGKKTFAGILAGVILVAAIAAGVMAFYPWLSSEMKRGKQVMTVEEWERGDGEETEENNYIDGIETESDYYIGISSSAVYRGYIVYTYTGNQVWMFPEYEKVYTVLELVMAGAVFLVVAAGAALSAVRSFALTESFVFRMPFELMSLIGVLILGCCLGSGMGPDMACAALSGETQQILTGYYHMGQDTARGMVFAVNYGSWLFMGLVLFWMTVTAASFFTLRPVRWLKERTLTGIVVRISKNAAVKTFRQLEQIDLKERSTRILLKIVGINFILLTIMCSMWFFGIFGLIVYSILLYVILRKAYERVQEKYQVLLQATNQLAEGNLDVEITEDLGVFEPFKDEIQKIQSGFKKAVDAEVKSQKMKTELITNVSHDLKTPLTAIITYVNLLKASDVTEEQRQEYIKVLDQKSMRLKSLIEDLFEVSKANSKNITLNLVEVDVVSLMKQVRLELDERLSASGVDFRFRFSDHKTVLMLDSEKTYRVFENLLVNIAKYGMSGTRAYVEIEERDKEERGKEVMISMKNISATELPEDGKDLTGRFVRGDQSRNTEGSGLGLAIAKSFVEIQKGSFQVETEADLFKVTIVWEK